MTSDDWSSEEYNEEVGEDEFEEIDEMELLRILDQEQDPLDVCRSLFTGIELPEHLKDLLKTGLVVMNDVFTTEECISYEKEAMEYLNSSKMTPASQYRLEDDPLRSRTAREDLICWLSENTSGSLQSLVSKVVEIRNTLSKYVKLNGENEFQLAYYPPGIKGYETHRDSFPAGDEDTEQRRLTMIIYINTHNWTPKDGGQLRIHRKGIEQDILPTASRAVIFLSGVVDHQVLPTTKDRFAMTCWMK